MKKIILIIAIALSGLAGCLDSQYVKVVPDILTEDCASVLNDGNYIVMTRELGADPVATAILLNLFLITKR